jgi:hypothetical protein
VAELAFCVRNIRDFLEKSFGSIKAVTLLPYLIIGYFFPEWGADNFMGRWTKINKFKIG